MPVSQKVWADTGGRDVARGAFASLALRWVSEKGLTLTDAQLSALFCAHGLCMAS